MNMSWHQHVRTLARRELELRQQVGELAKLQGATAQALLQLDAVAKAARESAHQVHEGLLTDLEELRVRVAELEQRERDRTARASLWSFVWLRRFWTGAWRTTPAAGR